MPAQIPDWMKGDIPLDSSENPAWMKGDTPVGVTQTSYDNPTEEMVDLAYKTYHEAVQGDSLTPLHKDEFSTRVKENVSDVSDEDIGKAYDIYMKDYGIQYWTRSAFEKEGLHKDWLPLVKQERTHFEKIAESWKRGKQNIEIDKSYGDAIINRDEDAQNEIYKQYKKNRARDTLDPVDSSNILTKAQYGATNIAAGMETSVESAIPYMTAGAGIAAVAGQAGPQVALPEEIVTVPAAMGIGYKVGSLQFWFRQGLGSISLGMREQGLESTSSKVVATVAAVPYAMLELAQVGQLIPGIRKGAHEVIKKSIMRVLLNAGKTYAKTLATEDLEEVGQEVITIVAEDLASYFEGEGLNVSKQDLIQKGQRLLTTAKEAAISMALLPLPGAMVDVVTGKASLNKQNKSLEAIKSTLIKEHGLSEEQAEVSLSKAFIRTMKEFKDSKNPTEEQITDVLRSHLADTTAGFMAENTLSEEALIPQLETAEGSFGIEDDYGVMDGSSYKLTEQQQEVNQKTVETSLKEIMNLVDEAKPKEREQRELRSKEKGKRFGEAGDKLTAGKQLHFLYSAKAVLKGIYTSLQFEAIRPNFGEEQLQNLVWSIRSNDKLNTMEKINTEDALMGRLLNPEGIKLIRPFEMRLFEKAFGKEFAESISKKRGLVNVDALDVALKALNLPRTMLASMDISHPLRQGLPLLFRHPILWGKHTGLAYKIFFGKKSKEIAGTTQQRIETSRHYDLMVDHKLEILPFESVTAEAAEQADEFIGAQYAEKIPGLGKGIRRSERAFVAPANYFRANVFSYYVDQWEKSGRGVTDEEYDDLAAFINVATLRAPVNNKTLKKLIPVLNAGLFSPRAAMSRVRLPYEIVRSMNPGSKMSWRVRKMIWGNVVAAASGVVGVISLASMIPGVTTEKDPRSSDFCKIRIGNTRIDISAGFCPLVRMVARMMKGNVKATDTDKFYDVSRKEIVFSYLRSQLNPSAGMAVDYISGKTFLGDDFYDKPTDLLRIIKENFIPFAIQDIADAIYYQDLTTGLLTSPLAIMGAGVQTYPMSPNKQATMLKDKISRQYFGQRWEDVGPVSQKLLREYNPRIERAEARAKFENTNTTYLNKMAVENKKSSDRLTKTLPKKVQKELDSLMIKLPGLSRKVGGNWYLNKKMAEEYHVLTSMYLNIIISQIINMPEWRNADDLVKKQLIEKSVTKLKSMARSQIIEKANRKDLITLGEYSHATK